MADINGGRQQQILDTMLCAGILLIKLILVLMDFHFSIQDCKTYNKLYMGTP